RSGRNNRNRAVSSAHQHHHHTATADLSSVIRYTVTSLHRIYDSTIQRFNFSTRRSHSSFNASPVRTIRHSSFRAEDAVTIIEMLVVIMVIFIIASLVLADSSYLHINVVR